MRNQVALARLKAVHGLLSVSVRMLGETVREAGLWPEIARGSEEVMWGVEAVESVLCEAEQRIRESEPELWDAMTDRKVSLVLQVEDGEAVALPVGGA